MVVKSFNKVIKTFQSRGMRGLFRAIFSRAFPARALPVFREFKSLFEGRIGLEVGGPTGIFARRGLFPIYPIVERVDNCNFGSQTIWEGSLRHRDEFIYDSKRQSGIQYINDATNLNSISSSSRDFVLSSHTLEHVANPILALAELIRVLKTGGVLVLMLPHKDATFDHRRPVTELSHLVEDFQNQITEKDLTHLEEILKLHDLEKDPGAGSFESFKERSNRNYENRCLHHHVFDTRLAVDLVDYMGLEISHVQAFPPYNILIIARKQSKGKEVTNESIIDLLCSPAWKSPFPSDKLLRH